MNTTSSSTASGWFGAVAVATDWAGAHLGVTPGRQRTLALSFATLSVVLLAAFVVVNAASFDSGVASTQN
ncbi:hypothetical protein [Halorubellus sp. PRR65]|uniref:hypothetical protein n=1 Tax=Halorubellus sp. PRR65 TaxID=3098148 RepID=UPI002B25CCC7|nr:hypothetical protein [Halorubellus sp. PRR65]